MDAYTATVTTAEPPRSTGSEPELKNPRKCEGFYTPYGIRTRATDVKAKPSVSRRLGIWLCYAELSMSLVARNERRCGRGATHRATHFDVDNEGCGSATGRSRSSCTWCRRHLRQHREHSIRHATGSMHARPRGRRPTTHQPDWTEATTSEPTMTDTNSTSEHCGRWTERQTHLRSLIQGYRFESAFHVYHWFVVASRDTARRRCPTGPSRFT